MGELVRPGGLPKLVQIGPHRYTVLVDYLTGQRLLAEVDYNKSTITVNVHQSETQMRDSLLHEVLHAILDMIGVGERLGLQQLLDHDQEERLVRGVTPHLLDLLRRNPDLVSFLLAEEE